MSTGSETLYRQRTFKLDDVDSMTEAIHEDGFALIPGVLSPEDVEAACQMIDKLEPFGFDSRGKTDHYKCVFNRDPYWLQFLDQPGVIDLAEATMGSQCHIIGQTAWRSHPGHNGWSPHTDRVFFELPEEVAAKVKIPIYLCTAHYYLSDITEELCPTYVIPGSHKSGRSLDWGKDPEPKWEGRGLEPVICKAGDVLFFRSDVWHSGSLNATQDQVRYLLQVHYSHRFIAQQFSPYITWQFNPEVIAACNPRQLRLLGNHKQGAKMAAAGSASVSLSYRNDLDAANGVVGEIASGGGRAFAVQAEIADAASLDAAVDEAVAQLGPLTSMVVSAGVFEGCLLEQMTPEFWDRTMSINVRGTFLAVRAAARQMRAAGKGGSIIIYTSTAGQRGSAEYSAYATSKGAQIMFMRSMAKELAPDRIRVNCVAPAWTETDMAAPSLDALGREAVAAGFPLGRIGLPKDVAGATCFLLSDLAGFITGSTITVDGGMDMRG